MVYWSGFITSETYRVPKRECLPAGLTFSFITSETYRVPKQHNRYMSEEQGFITSETYRVPKLPVCTGIWISCFITSETYRVPKPCSQKGTGWHRFITSETYRVPKQHQFDFGKRPVLSHQKLTGYQNGNRYTSSTLMFYHIRNLQGTKTIRSNTNPTTTFYHIRNLQGTKTYCQTPHLLNGFITSETYRVPKRRRCLYRRAAVLSHQKLTGYQNLLDSRK